MRGKKRRKLWLKHFGSRSFPVDYSEHTYLHFPSWALPHLGNVFQFLEHSKLSPVSAYVISSALFLDTPTLPIPFSLEYTTFTWLRNVSLKCSSYAQFWELFSLKSFPWVAQAKLIPSICIHAATNSVLISLNNLFKLSVLSHLRLCLSYSSLISLGPNPVLGKTCAWVNVFNEQMNTEQIAISRIVLMEWIHTRW